MHNDEAHRRSGDLSPFAWLLKYWTIIVFVIGISATAGVMLHQTAQVDRLEEKVQTLRETVARIDERTARIAAIESKIDTLVLRGK